MVRSWSEVGGLFSTTSRLYFSGGAEGFDGGYGDESAERSNLSALVDAGEEGL